MSQFYDLASLVMLPSGYRSGKVYSQKPLSTDGELTFTRNSNATRVNADGLVEKVRTNYCRYSQDFGSWSAIGSAIRTTGVTDPNGGTTAATISNIPSGNFADGIMLSNNLMTIGGEPIIGSVWLKGSGTIGLALERSVSGDYFFYTTLVTLTSTWTRYTIGGSSSGSRAGFTFYITNKTGSTATSVDVAFAQTEYGDIATDYIPTTSAAVSVGPTANVPRLNYSNGCPSLLLEPQRTNLALWSEQIDNAAWTKVQITTTANSSISPDGYTNADKIAINNGISGGYAYQSIATTSSTVYTMSFFVKAAGINYTQFYSNITGVYNQAVINLTTGAITNSTFAVTPTVTNYGNGWWRVSYTQTSGGYPIPIYIDAGTTSNGASITGNGTDGILIWGAQVEAGSYATSYIPTLGASVTRLADAAYKTGISSLIGQTEGTFFVDIDYTQNSDYNVLIETNDGATTNRAVVFFGTGNDLNVSMGVMNFSYAMPSNGHYKIAFAYKSGDSALYVNGANVANSTTAFSVSTMSNLNIANNVFGGQISNNPTRQALLFKTRLTNAQLAELTTL